MGQEIYNEGRVVGLSAWELFAKIALSNGIPEEVIPNEKQWLTAMLGSGSSLILRVPSGTTKGILDCQLPSDSNLSAAGVVIASPFMGQCEWDDISNFATKVTAYGTALNTSGVNPPDENNDLPADESYNNAIYKNCVSEFAKITDGIVFTRNANWVDTNGVPEKDIDPNFNESSTVVRLYISSDINQDVAILLTGFHNKRILQGLSNFADTQGVGGSCDTANNDWANGGMLGPEVIPWASKIIFTLPNSAYNLANSLTRTIPADTQYTIPEGGLNIGGIVIKENAIDSEVKPNSFIDFNSINLTDYYSVNSVSGSTLTEDISDVALGISDSYNELVAWYPGMTAAKLGSNVTAKGDFFPPALYAAQIDASGSGKILVPLDVAAPGTVKVFKTDTEASKYIENLPNNYAIYHNTETNAFTFAISGASSSDWPGLSKLVYTTAPQVTLTVGNTSANLISLTDANGDAYDTTGSAQNPITVGPENNLTWKDMLDGLKDGKKLDILGAKLHNLGTELKTSNTIGVTNAVTKSGSQQFVLDPGSNQITVQRSGNLAQLNSGKSIKVGDEYIEFTGSGSGRSSLRLYISSSAPTSGMRVGDIGIGW